LRLRKGYIDSAEALIRLVEPDQEYPYEFVVFKVTGYRPNRRAPVEPIGGEDLRQDLLTLILDLCDSFDLPAEVYEEEVFDTASLAKRQNVSTKTIQRWRRRGLVARRLIFPDGQKRIAFLTESVEAFTTPRKDLVKRSAKFRQLTEAERARIVRRARRLVARTGCSRHELCKHIARRMHRAVETVRYTIRRHDREHPDQAVFPGVDAPLDEEARALIYRCFLHGVPVTELAGRFQRTRGSIYRIVNEMRARQLLNRKIEYVHNEEFDQKGAEKRILAESTDQADDSESPKQPKAPKDLPPYLKSLYDVPLLTGQQERNLFRQYNFLKYRADQLRGRLDLSHLKAGQLRKIEKMLVLADSIKNRIIRANLRLVVSIAKKHLNGPQTLFELISDGNVSLMRAVEKFDYGRGCKFSTYASWAIIKNFARSVPRERYLLDRFVTGGDEVLELAAGMSRYDPHETSLREVRESLDAVLAQLTPRERSIVVHHYGLDNSGMGQTLEQLSGRLGISRERVRQIERGAMEKLRNMLKPDRADLMR
jgi:RNA polymerase sigma factor (sigma-70 family)